MKRFFRVGVILLVVGLMLTVPVAADEEFDKGFTESEVRTAVEAWVRYVTADARPDAVVDHLDPHVVEGVLVGYIVHLQGGGFCLAGGNSLLLPVYFYSPAASYDPTNPEYQYILWEMAERLHYLIEAQTQGTEAQSQGYPGLEAYQLDLARRASLWQDLINGRIPAKVGGIEVSPTRMELGLTSRWGQDSPYNDQCPNLTPGHDEHAATGCVRDSGGSSDELLAMAPPGNRRGQC